MKLGAIALIAGLILPLPGCIIVDADVQADDWARGTGGEASVS